MVSFSSYGKCICKTDAVHLRPAVSEFLLLTWRTHVCWPYNITTLCRAKHESAQVSPTCDIWRWATIWQFLVLHQLFLHEALRVPSIIHISIFWVTQYPRLHKETVYTLLTDREEETGSQRALYFRQIYSERLLYFALFEARDWHVYLLQVLLLRLRPAYRLMETGSVTDCAGTNAAFCIHWLPGFWLQTLSILLLFMLGFHGDPCGCRAERSDVSLTVFGHEPWCGSGDHRQKETDKSKTTFCAKSRACSCPVTMFSPDNISDSFYWPLLGAILHLGHTS